MSGFAALGAVVISLKEEPKNNYNRVHKKIRRLIENAIGELKPNKAWYVNQTSPLK